VEYDVWVKPCADFPEGQVIRFAGDSDPVVIHSDEEQLPGPLPYHNAKGDPLFPFHHARYDEVGGRALGSSLIDPAIGKQDQFNQLDSHMLMMSAAWRTRSGSSRKARKSRSSRANRVGREVESAGGRRQREAGAHPGRSQRRRSSPIAR
jgi:hypothetical protein